MQTLPKIGEPAFVAGISFPLTLLSINENTRTASLGGAHPETGMDVLLPQVCLSLLFTPEETAAPVLPPFTLAAGDVVRFKGGGPRLTVAWTDDANTEMQLVYWSVARCEFVTMNGVHPDTVSKIELCQPA